MTDSSYAHIAFAADRSGSMGDMADPPHTKARRTTQGIHAFVREQAALPGRVTFSLLDFDNETSQVESFGDGSAILAWECRPRNSTALLDAIGAVVTGTGEALEAMPEDDRPGRVYIVIGTDGLENASKEYTLDRIKSMVAEQRDSYGWQFVYIGTELEAFSSGASMSFAAGSTMATPAAATSVAYAASSDAVTSSRSTGGAVSYTAEQRQQVADAGRKKN